MEMTHSSLQLYSDRSAGPVKITYQFRGYTMVYTVTLNPSIDYVVEMGELRRGCLNRATNTKVYPGGKGINVSAVLNSLGVENKMFGFVAGFTGNELVRSLTAEGLTADFIKLRSGLTRINMKVCESVSTEINTPGPNITKDNLKELADKLGELKDGDVLVLSGSIPQGLPTYTYRTIMELVKDRDIKIIVDTSGEQLLATLECHPFLIKPNRTELEELFSTKILLTSDAEKFAHSLQDMGARNVLVSLDSEGALLLREDGSVLHHDAFQGQVINPVGAGDSMVAGFIAGYLKNNDFSEAFKTGIAAGSAAAFSNGLPSSEDILSLTRLM